MKLFSSVELLYTWDAVTLSYFIEVLVKFVAHSFSEMKPTKCRNYREHGAVPLTF